MGMWVGGWEGGLCAPFPITALWSSMVKGTLWRHWQGLMVVGGGGVKVRGKKWEEARWAMVVAALSPYGLYKPALTLSAQCPPPPHFPWALALFSCPSAITAGM